MTKRILRLRRRRNRRIRNLVILACMLFAGVTWAGSVVQFFTAKSLPQATIDVIDPESGTSSGTSGSDVNIANGDIILFKFAVAGAPASSNESLRGAQAYLTEYVPPNTVLVGARLVDANNNTIEPRPAGLTLYGCKTCNNAPGVDGTIAQVYADTGIFYTTTSLSGDPLPNNKFLTTDGPTGAVEMFETPAEITPKITTVLNDTTGNWFAHNDWDYDQVVVFGASSSAYETGNTPFGYGSPVAGPQTYYQNEANAAGGLGGVGPWNRVKYPGSQIGQGPGDVTDQNFTRVGIPTTSGTDVIPAAPVSAKAVRFAMGEPEVGEVRFAEVALKVNGLTPANPFIDPTFGTGNGANVDCAESFASDAASNGNSSLSGNTNPWSFFIPHPQCVFLRLKFDFTVDDTHAVGGQTLTYKIAGKNLALTTETNATATIKPVSADQGSPTGTTLLNGSPATPTVATCPAPDGNRTCYTFALGSLAPGDEFDIEMHFAASGSGKRTNTVKATYHSTQLDAIDADGFSNFAMTTVLAVSGSDVELDNVLDPTASFAAVGSTTWAIGDNPSITGLDSYVISEGTIDWTSSSFRIHLPDGTWNVLDDDGTLDSITVGGNDTTCTHTTATINGAIAGGANDIVRTSNVVTVNTVANHTFAAGDWVTISGVTGGTFNGTFQITSVPNNKQFTYLQTGANETRDGGVANATIRDCARSTTLAPGSSAAIAFRVGVPSTELNGTTTKATGVYTVGISAFGDAFETYRPNAVEIPVGAVRSHKPVLNCPINSSGTSISGVTGDTTNEATAAIVVKFNLQDRGSATAAGGAWTSTNYTAFGELYGGLEVRATAQQPSENVSELSTACFVTSTRQCSDSIDNSDPEDTLADFPADPGCTSPSDNDETDPVAPECSDGVDNADTDVLVDWPADPECTGPTDTSEGGTVSTVIYRDCQDGVDNDTDGFIDYAGQALLVTANATTDTFTTTAAHGFAVNDGPYWFSTQTTLPTGISGVTAGVGTPTKYWIKTVPSSTTFTVSATLGGAAVNFTSNGVGRQWLNVSEPGCHSLFDDDEFDSGASTADIKARLVLAVDSSGSMNWNACVDGTTLPAADFTGGDGSTECPGTAVACQTVSPRPAGTCGTAATPDHICENAVADDSRLYQVLDGLSNVVAGFGEVEYSMLRFHQIAQDFACPTTSAGRQSGGWQGGGASPCSGGFNAGDLIVSNAIDNEVTILNWMNHDGDYPVAGNPPYGTDWEIRGSGTTPLAGILSSADAYIQNVIDNDLQDECRPYRVVLVTDGGETCGGNAPAAASSLFFGECLIGGAACDADSDCAGATNKCIHQAPVTVIGFATPTLGASLDAIAASGGTGASIQVDSEAELSAAIVNVIQDAILVERCNGLDDDCDFPLVDEDFPDLGTTCTAGKGICLRTGAIECKGDFTTGCSVVAGPPDPGGEQDCNLLDDDCDGKVDEGSPTCTCQGTSEICNGQDEDCDGLVDEGVTPAAGPCDDDGDCAGSATCNVGTGLCTLPGVGDQCGTTDTGPCQFGSLSCVNSGTCPGPTCTGELQCSGNIEPGTEVCGNGDEDCDGATDEGVSACYGSDGVDGGTGCVLSGGVYVCQGLCQPGTRTCATGAGQCDADVVGTVEVCDGLDNDCDGTPDDGFNLGTTCTIGQGVCTSTGVLQCNGLGGVECTAPVIPPGPETCSAVDDDCDGLTDEPCSAPGTNPSCVGAPVGNSCGSCGGTFVCNPSGPGDPTPIECGSTNACPNGNSDCTGGATCVSGFCQLSCCSQEVCDGADNDCDGTADDEIPGFGGPCVPSGSEQYFTCVDGGGATCVMGTSGCTCTPNGTCDFGHLECEGGSSVCRDFTGPLPEIACNNIDEDCDGDDLVTCPGAQACTPLGCALPCMSGEIPCGVGFQCVDFPSQGRYCVDDPCVNANGDPLCTANERCEVSDTNGDLIPDTATCVDLCAGINCPGDSVCSGGACKDCFDPGFGCEDACETCVLDEATDVGTCIADPCCGVECEATEFCSEGDCLGTTCTPECGDGQTCVEGECRDDMCAGVFCDDGFICDPDNGRCVSDPCIDTDCPDGERCSPNSGDCIPDECQLLTCPEGTDCVIIAGDEFTCMPPQVKPDETITAAGGGCCSTGRDQDQRGTLLLGLIAIVLVRRRRK